MKLGEMLLNLRKSKQLSQEEAAERLGVSRQTISKWETDQSMPDFDKIIPLCELYGITPDELFTGEKKDLVGDSIQESSKEELRFLQKKRASGIGRGILLYFISIVWIAIAIPVCMLNPIVASTIFLLICGIATYIVVYTCIAYKMPKTKKEQRENKLRRSIQNIIAIITTITYLLISFTTMAWHITWIMWVVYGLIGEILRLIFMLRGNEDEK